ncbi:YmfQ family protein [Brenneria uluponensis]|uniref:YmfQ family protein n=1 Tax=Brenneria uluponensis TaxID=3057057 RepID=UPI0028EA1BB9|nr:putative phage tail protein [Brenneria ulupoensis]
MGLTDKYEYLLSSLLPHGPAWDSDDPLLLGLASSLAKAHQRSDDLMAEADPRTVTELLDRYEAISGLPDSCAPDGVQTLAQRRQRLDAKINLAGGINEAFYLKQLKALGYEDVTISRYNKSVFRCTSTCLGGAFSDSWKYYWQVNFTETTKITNMACTGRCTDSVRTWGDAVAECVMEKLAPSHTYVIFKYPSE